MTIRETAAALGVHYMTAYEWLKAGLFKTARKRGVQWFIEEAEVLELKAKRAARG